MALATPVRRGLLDVLPTELIVLILAEADIASIARFQRCSRGCYDIVSTAEQTIFESIAEKCFDAFTPCTAGDSGITRDALPVEELRRYDPLAGQQGATHEHEEDQREGVLSQSSESARQLKRAIRCHRTGASSVFNGVLSWKQYVERRIMLRRSWKSGRPSRYILSEDEVPHNLGCWRFKVCSITGTVIKSTPVLGHLNRGAVTAYRPRQSVHSARRLFMEVTRGYTHVEYSNGHLVFIENERIQVYGPPDPGSAHDFLQFKHTIKPDDHLSSYKLRYPDLITASATSNKLYIYDVQTGHLAREYQRLDGPHRSYVEIDQWSLFFADITITVLDRAKGLEYSLLEPLADNSLAELDSTTWSAVHHSLDGRHVIAVGDANELVWFRNYRTFLTDEVHVIDKLKRDANTVVLRLQEAAGEIQIDNLAVENDRVVFSTRSETFPVVYYFELSDWEHLSVFKHSTPVIRVLSGGVPTGFDGISRIEMDSACIYLTCSTNSSFSQIPGFQDIHPADLEMAWCHLDGTELCNATVRPVWPASSPAMKHDMQDTLSVIRIMHNDEIMCYDFGQPEIVPDGEGLLAESDPSEAMFEIDNDDE